TGEKAAAAALRDWRDLHDPFELRERIEARLARISKLDVALNTAQNEGENDQGGRRRFSGASSATLRRPRSQEPRPGVTTETIHQTTHPKECYGDNKSSLIRRPSGVVY
ncbi:MAG: hypothetical protein KGR69_15455, partial [Verrucomicrobia bacterium]|nr:hypothetical protein [Verrucomicrobiota bacterium]